MLDLVLSLLTFHDSERTLWTIFNYFYGSLLEYTSTDGKWLPAWWNRVFGSHSSAKRRNRYQTSALRCYRVSPFPRYFTDNMSKPIGWRLKSFVVGLLFFSIRFKCLKGSQLVVSLPEIRSKGCSDFLSQVLGQLNPTVRIVVWILLFQCVERWSNAVIGVRSMLFLSCFAVFVLLWAKKRSLLLDHSPLCPLLHRHIFSRAEGFNISGISRALW